MPHLPFPIRDTFDPDLEKTQRIKKLLVNIESLNGHIELLLKKRLEFKRELYSLLGPDARQKTDNDEAINPTFTTS